MRQQHAAEILHFREEIAKKQKEMERLQQTMHQNHAEQVENISQEATQRYASLEEEVARS